MRDLSETYRLEVVAGAETRVAEVSVGRAGPTAPAPVRWRGGTEVLGHLWRDASGGYAWHSEDGHRAGQAPTLARAVLAVVSP